MTIPVLPSPPAVIPQRGDSQNPDEWIDAADAWVAYEAQLASALNDWINAIILVQSGLDFTATSTTSNSVGTGSKSWSIGTGKAYQIGMKVYAAQTSNTGNRMTGTVTGYSGGTITIDMTGSVGSGTHTDWTIGLEVSAAAVFTGGTLTSLLTLVAAASGQESLVIPHGSAPSSPTNGSVWTTTAGVFIRLNGTTYQIATLTGTQTLIGKTLQRAIGTAALQETPYTITDGGSVDIDPANGGIQTWTLGASRTPTATNMASGDSVQLRIADGTAYSVTWSTIGVVWVGGSAPTLATSGYTVIELWKIGSTVYGARVGDVAS